ncbi:hypothetical protein SHKM778_59670 [Streptomyces sp. KM77-8]|uniref:Uncharacterized protein n=1 Tax=Streptomyces haneummycinicus TaxID=3074435 RepID=A0AAT9HQW9_9ACTN
MLTRKDEEQLNSIVEGQHGGRSERLRLPGLRHALCVKKADEGQSLDGLGVSGLIGVVIRTPEGVGEASRG